MIYFEQKPFGQLANYIDKFWFCEADELHNKTLSIPLLHHELVFNFSVHHSFHTHEQASQAGNAPMAWIAGIQTKPIVSENSGRHEMLGVLFKPFGLKAFTHYHSKEFENKLIDASLVFGADFSHLLDNMQEAEGGYQKIVLLQDFLLEQITVNKLPDYLKPSMKLMTRVGHEKTYIRDICEDSAVSNKSMVQTYQKHIGISPAKFQNLHTINKALLLLSRNPKQSLTQLAYELNFADQSHFTHQFKKITSLTPKQYAKQVLNNQVDDTSPNFISL